MHGCRRLLLAFAVILALFAPDALYAVESCGPPRKASPQRVTGGESFPPLPLPATPLRRTEKKREPRPPSLFAKIAYGPESQITDGKKVAWPDWKTDPDDIGTLLGWLNAQLNINYGSIESSFDKFPYDPAEIPVMYVTGHNPPTLTAAQAARIRAFLQDGGYLVADACCGSQDFRNAFEKDASLIFPDRPLRELPLEHALFTSAADVTSVRYLKDGKESSGPPAVRGIDIGCRTAVFYFPYDVSCGWSGHEHPTGERIRPDDARRLGANLVTYIIANYQLGRYLSSTKVYYQAGEKTRDEFVFGQIIHDGDWDPSPGGIADLLEYVDRETSINVQYKKAAVRLESPDIFAFPFLYMVGHYDFTFSDAAVANLRRFIENGGILFAEACCGRREFDAAFRREMAKVLPSSQLSRVSLDAPLYNCFFRIDDVSYTPYAQATLEGVTKPLLEGIAVDGTLAVIYSRYAVANGWEQFDHPYSKGYDSASAFKIGVNVLVYAMSH